MSRQLRDPLEHMATSKRAGKASGAVRGRLADSVAERIRTRDAELAAAGVKRRGPILAKELRVSRSTIQRARAATS